VGVEKLVRAKLAKIKLRQDAPQTTFSVSRRFVSCGSPKLDGSNGVDFSMD
jgi:hypothetical protein